MAITYKTVISNAISGFNRIQKQIYDNSAQLTNPDVSVKSVDEIVSALPHVTLGVSVGVTPSITSSAVNSGGSFTGATAAASESYVIAPTSYNVVNSYDINDGSFYYIKGTASGSGTITVTPKASYSANASVNKAGLVKASDTSASGSLSKSATAVTITGTGSSTQYIKLAKSALTCSLSTTTQPKITIGGTTNMSTTSSGTYYFTRTGTNTNGTISCTDTITAGYAPASTTNHTLSVAATYTGNGTVYIPTATCSGPASTSSGTAQKTVTPTTTAQYVNISAGYTPASHIKVNGDANLVASNIKSGVSIFGISGTYAPSGELSITTSHTANASINVSNYATVKVTGVKVANGAEFNLASTSTTATWVISQDANGNLLFHV